MTFKVGFHPQSDTTSLVHMVLRDSVGLNVVYKPLDELEEDLERGRITAILNVIPSDSTGNAPYVIDMKSSGAANIQNVLLLRSIIQSVILRFNEIVYEGQPSVAVIKSSEIKGREYKTIDFILPGQLGFSLLSAGVFGVAFIFFNLRQALVLKRFFATPIHKSYIIAGEALSRVIFQMVTAIIILTLGHYVFGFTLVNGWVTFLELLFLSFLGLIVFMGFGFIVSGVAKNDAAIAPFTNLITLPQFLLAGTFFPIDNFPKWLQPVSKVLPLTHLNQAMRDVAFEGAHISDCVGPLTILLLWGAAAYTVAVMVFKWE
jgi:ABC-2 type transport system permease protein